MKKKFSVWFTLGTNKDGKIVAWGEPHMDKELAMCELSMGNEHFKNNHLSGEYLTSEPSKLFEKLSKSF